MFPGLHPMAMMSTVGMGFSRGTSGFPAMYGSGPPANTGHASSAPYPSMYPQGGSGAAMGQPPPMGGPNDAQVNLPAMDDQVSITYFYFFNPSKCILSQSGISG